MKFGEESVKYRLTLRENGGGAGLQAVSFYLQLNCFLATSEGCFFFRFCRSIFFMACLNVSRLSGLPCNCMTGWRIRINFHFEAARSVVRITRF